MTAEPILRISDKTRTATKADGTRIRVVDGKKAFIVRVNQKHIDAAVPNDRARCMYCLACAEQYGSELVWVTRTRAYVELSNAAGVSELVRCVLPTKVMKYMKDHDMNLKHLIKPHTVTFDPPAPYQSLDRIYYQKAKSNQRLAAKRKAASMERKVNEIRLRKGLPPFEHYEPIEPVPLPEFAQPKPEPAVAHKPRKKQDPTANFELRPGSRGDFCWYRRAR